jgi:hypothetical protein
LILSIWAFFQLPERGGIATALLRISLVNKDSREGTPMKSSNPISKNCPGVGSSSISFHLLRRRIGANRIRFHRVYLMLKEAKSESELNVQNCP